MELGSTATLDAAPATQGDSAPITDGGGASAGGEASSPAGDQQAMTTEARDAAAREIFNKIADKHGFDDGVAGRIGGDADAGEAAQPNATAGTETNSVEDAAIAQLLEAGMPEEQISAWYQRDKDGLVKFANAQSKISPPAPAASAKAADAGASTQTAAEAAKAEPAPAPKDYIEATKLAIDELLKGAEADGQFYDSQTQILGVMATSLAEKLGSYVAGELQKRDAVMTQMSQQLQTAQFEAQVAKVDAQMDTARAELVSQYPDLGKPEVYAKVQAEYDALIDASEAQRARTGQPKYTTVKQAFVDAVKHTFADANPANAVDRIKKGLFDKTRQQRRAVPHANQTRPKDQPLTREQKAWAFFNKVADQHEGTLAS